MSLLNPMLGSRIKIEISGRFLPIRGTLIDIGTDIIVVNNGTQYLYLPVLHIQKLEPDDSLETIAAAGGDQEQMFDHTDISYRKILMNAKGIFTEVGITGFQSLHGYITSIMNDYFVFFSPVYRTVYVSLQHVKLIIPYAPNRTPYYLSRERFPLQPPGITLARTFDQQMKKLEGELIALDLGESPSKIGLLKSVDNRLVELVGANGQHLYMHGEHVKTIHVP
ncbi:DUF2642 domain-containing protein [Paenibacillus flagellatus]|uniref:DUF2642 domain-containing protein n=1 Tax=Paenibacillus flagellatus TaxID=2211139 RepID=A0A2V5JYW2_9BACL|nr:DUF2642 domain-containing protein [Paenibacillus flagellatus]PYI52099.1 DUF2642 domain-containing protein [Paenibacillus flagellatus]